MVANRGQLTELLVALSAGRAGVQDELAPLVYAELKRGGDAVTVSLEVVAEPGAAARTVDMLALDSALNRLEVQSERARQVVECRYFGGLSIAETAEALGASPMTVKRDWRTARAWLARELASGV